MDDISIIKLYECRDETAIEHTVKAYEGYCRSIASRILDDPQDVEEVLSDTWMKVWQSIPPHKPEYLRLYLAKITRNLALSTYRSNTAEKRGGSAVEVALDELTDCIPGSNTPEQEVDRKLLLEHIQRFLRTCSDRERAIFIRRYFYLESTAQIAQQYRLRDSNILSILSRTRKKLKQYLIQEGCME